MRTIAPLKPENGGNWWSSAVVSVRVKSLVEGTIGNQWSRPVSEGKCPGQNWGSRGRRFKSGQPDQVGGTFSRQHSGLCSLMCSQTTRAAPPRTARDGPERWGSVLVPANRPESYGFSLTADFDSPHQPGRRVSLSEGVGEDALSQQRHRTAAASCSGPWRRGGASTQVLIACLACLRNPGRRLWSRRGPSVHGGAARGTRRTSQET